jgi:hypothetical protein
MLSWMPVLLCLALASCSPIRHAILRNASGVDLLLWPLGARPTILKAGESTEPTLFYAHERHEALIKRGNCLYTYPAPDYFALPKAITNYKPITAVIHPDMRLSVHRRSKEGVEGPEILVAGFPIRPTTFCGSEGGG